ncbi:MAG: hypothetical protein JNK49_14055 [Planctomycetes bacterium]|nr:hypothetical protein [Planctomycetota bacterium]
MNEPRTTAVRFALAELPEQLAAFAARWPQARADRRGLVFRDPARMAALRVPLLAPRVEPFEPLAAYAERAEAPLGSFVLLLLRAGALAVGYWDGAELLDHRAERRYVVRGHGKAQPLHQKTRGKSRYGARLRLQNWRRLLTTASERLHRQWQQFGAPERIFCGAPVRVRAELFAAEPPPPFRGDDPALVVLPMHSHRPDHRELLRVHHWLGHGRLELPAVDG